ncbi:MAG: Gfo/Idh/MocA family oxidoreductase [Hoeflea sp.]|uniref:Gfo/Idh/MocA family protein n=1 Tax=Hoeflea sp. TaxID=1940281 RepID=UPI0032975ADE
MRNLNVAMIGSGFMGRAHALAMASAPIYFHDLNVNPVRTVLVDVNESLAESARKRFGFAEATTDWRGVVARPDIDAVLICTPNDVHVDIAIEAAKNKKHILCEKPLASKLDDAQKMLAAVREAGITHMVAHNYRHTPAVALAKQIIDAGEIGEVLTFRGHYMQDWSADPDTPLSWRFSKAKSGSGTIGDIGSHVLDMARYLVGEIAEVCGELDTFVQKRPIQSGAYDKMGASIKNADAERGDVDVDDYAISLLKFDNGARGSLEASRNSWGRHNYLGFEIQGRLGSIVFNYERLNELQVMNSRGNAARAGFTTIYSGPLHPYGEYLWPVPGTGVGYLDIKIIECRNFLLAIEAGRFGAPSFEDGYRIAKICDCIEQSSSSRSWVRTH